jgi:hypothetical protein
MTSARILSDLLEFEHSFDGKIRDLELYNDKINDAEPKTIRRSYDRLMNHVGVLELEEEEIRSNLDKCITAINKCKEKIEPLNRAVNKLKLLLNRSKVGTLQGLALQKVKHSKPVSKTKLHQTVRSLPYDELKSLKSLNGGFSKKRRTIKNRRSR